MPVSLNPNVMRNCCILVQVTDAEQLADSSLAWDLVFKNRNMWEKHIYLEVVHLVCIVKMCTVTDLFLYSTLIIRQ